MALLLAALAAAGMLGGCFGGGGKTNPATDPRYPRVIVETTVGHFVMELDTVNAPNTTANILRYVDRGFYNGLVVHRVNTSAGFVAMGSHYASGDEKEAGSAIDFEPTGLKHVRGAVALLHGESEHSGRAAFMVDLADIPLFNPARLTDPDAAQHTPYAVFGRVVAGLDNVTAMTRMTKLYEWPDGSFSPFPIILLRAYRVGSPVSRDHGIDVAAATPQGWSLDAPQDTLLVWAHNRNNVSVPFRWSATLDGGPLPPGWSVTFDPPEGELAANATKSWGQNWAGNDDIAYPDWASTMVNLTVPLGVPLGNRTLRVAAVPTAAADGGDRNDAADGVQGGAVDVPLVVGQGAARGNGRVGQWGDRLTVAFSGQFANGTVFGRATFDLTLGEAKILPGFERGMLGAREGESLRLVLPPALAYGWDINFPQLRKYSGQWLTYDVEVRSLVSPSAGDAAG